MDIYELTKSLIGIPSISGAEEKIADYLNDLLKREGFETKIQQVEKNRKNIFARTGEKTPVVFCTHMDTVPPYFGPSEDEHFIYGRGACDAKGIMASMMEAARELKREGGGEIGLLFVVGEERDSIGAKKSHSLQADSRYIVLGEPTENKLGRAHKGMLLMRIKAEGRASHSAYPELGESAVEKLMDTLEELRRANLGEDRVLGKTFLNIGSIEGGIAPNVVADQAQAEVSLRTVWPSEKVLSVIKNVLPGRVSLEILTQTEPQQLFTLPSFPQTTLPYGTDIPHLKGWGKPLLLGPGKGSLAHTPKEKIGKKELKEAVRTYKNLARELLELKT
ncbi:M20/M25/M40 family metallo-hydrolase [bacterium]|nr:M20/M25/M40 family metallo-hydrolase [bacterium]